MNLNQDSPVSNLKILVIINIRVFKIIYISFGKLRERKDIKINNKYREILCMLQTNKLVVKCFSMLRFYTFKVIYVWNITYK